MREPRDDMYAVPPSVRLSYVLIAMSSRTYCVAEYNGNVVVDSEDIPTLPVAGASYQQFQHTYEFVMVSKPMSYQKATAYMAKLYAQRHKERPLILSKVYE